jgi:hypothetical protein
LSASSGSWGTRREKSPAAAAWTAGLIDRSSWAASPPRAAMRPSAALTASAASSAGPDRRSSSILASNRSSAAASTASATSKKKAASGGARLRRGARSRHRDAGRGLPEREPCKRELRDAEAPAQGGRRQPRERGHHSQSGGDQKREGDARMEPA